MPSDLREICTERLWLLATVPDDAAELFAMMSDPAGWWYEPQARHSELATTAAFAERAAARWLPHGLSYWTARVIGSGALVGIGGVQRHCSGSWNLSYRVAGDQQRQGYAGELARAGLDAAALVDAGSPVIAWVAEGNLPSRRVAERIGLSNQGPRVDASDGVLRLAYADRPLTVSSGPPADWT